MSFWVNLIYRGGRVCGLRESAHLALEMNRLPELLGQPGSEAARAEAKEDAAKKEQEYFRWVKKKKWRFHNIT